MRMQTQYRSNPNGGGYTKKEADRIKEETEKVYKGGNSDYNVEVVAEEYRSLPGRYFIAIYFNEKTKGDNSKGR